VEAIPASGQLDLALCLLAERVDRTGAFATDNAVSMAAWTRGQAHSSHQWASSRVLNGRALVDALPLTLAAWQRAELTREHVTVIRWAVDDLDAEGTAILRAALDKFMPKPEPGVLLSQRRARALVEMARQSLDFGTGHESSANKPHLVVSLSFEQLRDQLGVGYFPDSGTVPASTIRRLACDAKIIPIVLSSDGLPLDVGRTTRTIPPAIRTALNERDKACKAPDCDRPQSWTDAHHVVSWLDGGITALTNLVLLCRRHHTMVHQGKLRIEALGAQRFRFINTTERLRT
jgi:hypothetical protein